MFYGVRVAALSDVRGYEAMIGHHLSCYKVKLGKLNA